MSNKERCLSLCPGTVLSVLFLFLYSTGFIIIEVRFSGHDERLVAVEEAVIELKQLKQDSVSSNQDTTRVLPKNGEARQRTRRSESKSDTNTNDTADLRHMIQDLLTTYLRICRQRGRSTFCHRGRPGPPGKTGSKGEKGNQGKRGRKGSKGIMGQLGKSGKQGIMGPPGMKGDKGSKGDSGPPGMLGIKGEPGESISTPHVKISPSVLTVNESNTVSILCSASGNPPAQISWTKVNGSLPSNKVRVTLDGLMEITEARPEDAGNYKCMAKNLLGKDEKVAKIVVRSPPRISLSSGLVYALKGSNVTLPICRVVGFPTARIIWSKAKVKHEVLATNEELSIVNVQREDSGLYQCRASNDVGTDSANTYLVVAELPRIIVKPPSNLQAKVSENVSVECKANGDPQPKIAWSKENGDLPVGRSEIAEDGTLKIWKAELEDSGKYICMASSAEVFRSVSYAVQLRVRACNAVGVSKRENVPNQRFTASTFHSVYYPYLGRLHESSGGGGWCSETKLDKTDFLQVDMGSAHILCAVATQGVKAAAWTTSFKLQYSTDGLTWNFYIEQNVEKVFPGNTDLSSAVKNSLSTFVQARYVRFYPVTFDTHPCLRVELFALM